MKNPLRAAIESELNSPQRRHGSLIPTEIAGIPCKVEVTHFHRQPALGPSAESDWDCYGYVDIDFMVCDRRGRPAAWLASKMTDADVDRIEAQITQENEGV